MLSFWNSLVLVAAGGALGASLRFLTGYTVKGIDFPLGTLLVNGLGSFFIGFIAGLGTSQESLFTKPGPRIFFITGVLGGFTTFSAFSLETLELFQAGKASHAVFNIVLNNGVAIVLAYIGYIAADSLKKG